MRDLSLLAASHTQCWRVGSPVMFNRSPGEEREKERRKLFPPILAGILEDGRLCEETWEEVEGEEEEGEEDISTSFTAAADGMRSESKEAATHSASLFHSGDETHKSRQEVWRPRAKNRPVPKRHQSEQRRRRRR